MADAQAIIAAAIASTSVVPPTTPSAPVATFATPPPPSATAVTLLAAEVVAAATDGALLVKTALGTLALQTTLSLPVGTTLDLRLQPGNQTSATLLNIAEPTAAAEPPAQATQLSLGTTTITATVRGPAPPTALPASIATATAPPAAASPSVQPGPPATPLNSPATGSQLTLRIVAPSDAPLPGNVLTGQVVSTAAAETIVATPLGLLAVPRRLGLEPGALLSFEPIEVTPPPSDGDVMPLPVRPTGWPALDQAMAVLQSAAPELAARLHTVLAPTSPQQLGGTLLFLMGAIYGKGWPGEDIERALGDAGHDRLRDRLIDDAGELRQLAADPATGDWRTLMLPLLVGGSVQPIRFYQRRRKKKPGEQGEDGTRFIIEVDMSKLGPLQLDGLARDKRFDLVLRSQRALTSEIRQDATAIFHQAIAEAGLTGDIAFTVASRFAVTPMAALTSHVTVSV